MQMCNDTHHDTPSFSSLWPPSLPFRSGFRLLRLFFVLPLLALSLPLHGSAALPRDVVKVAVLKGADSVRVEGDDFLASDDRGQPLALSLPLSLRAEGGTVVLPSKRAGRVVFSAPSGLSVNGKRYRGLLEMIPVDGKILVVNHLPVEEYLIGLINCEISSQWPMEAVKAQAVVARSYALYQKELKGDAPYQLESSVLDQVYDGCAIEDGRSARAVRETEGEVLTYGGRVIQAFFHSSCGGNTEGSENVWGVALPYLQGVPCGYCGDSPGIHWEQQIPLRKIESALRGGGYSLSGIRDIRCSSRNRSGRVRDVTVFSSRGSVEVPAVKLRKLLGYSVLRSTAFTVSVSGDDAVFSGRGYGHGVGLCQWGARNRAADGFSYREILTYYYPGTTLEKVTP